MKALTNYDSVTVSHGGWLLPAGGYACKIVRVNDHTSEPKPYLGVVYDVLDPATKQTRFANELADSSNDWRHEFRFYMTSDFGVSRYKMLVECAEQSAENNGFAYSNVDGAEQTLVGKWVGFVIRHRLYTKQSGPKAGKDGETLDLAAILTCSEALSGEFNQSWLEPKDDREPKPEPAPAPTTATYVPDVAPDDIPF